jgi:hypothetical protein
VKINFDPQQFAARCLQDALDQALPTYWHRRAAAFDQVHNTLPLPIDAPPEVVLNASPAAQTALACRRHAHILQTLPQQPISDEVREVLSEVAA